MFIDKKLKILNCLVFNQYKDYFELLEETKIPEDEFKLLFDELGIDNYISAKDDKSTLVTLFSISAKQRYLKNRNKQRLNLFLSVVGTFSAVVAAVFAVMAFF